MGDTEATAENQAPSSNENTAARGAWVDQLGKAAAILGAFFAVGQTASQIVQGYFQHKIEETKAEQELVIARQKSDSDLASQFLTLVLNKETTEDKRSMLFDALSTLQTHPLRDWAKARHDEIERNLASLQQARDAGLTAIQETNAAVSDLDTKKAKFQELEAQIQLHREDPDKTSDLYQQQTILVRQISLASATQVRATAKLELVALGSTAARSPQAGIVSFHLPIESIRTALAIPAERKLFDEYMPFIEAALVESDLTDKKMAAAVVATANIETASFGTVTEASSGRAYEGRKDLGNTQEGDGERFKGRGLIQIVGRTNYARYSERLGFGSLLVDSPEQANKPEIAARILCMFFRDRKSTLTEALANDDLAVVRRLVNGGTNGLEPFRRQYEQVLVALGGDEPSASQGARNQ